ncbi:MAG: hypothetical protein HYV63_14400 [Candidatus Schekmanbacteria bacterium]|nr:hypothetical protein [Candidatus Schekmanbacteria bacterium]
MGMAVAVAQGKLTLDEAVKRLLSKERRRKLSEDHGLPPSFAGQVASGTISLDDALLFHRRTTYWSRNIGRTFFFDCRKQGTEIVLELQPHCCLRGKVENLAQYMFAFRPDDGPVHHLHKLFVKYAYPLASEAVVSAARSTDEGVRNLHIPPRARTRERPKIRRNELLDAMDRRAEVRMVLIEGEVFSGRVNWVSRFEVGLELAGQQEDGAGGPEIWILRHAIESCEIAASGGSDVVPGSSAPYEPDEELESAFEAAPNADSAALDKKPAGEKRPKSAVKKSKKAKRGW